jgi:hypothetical protein
VAKTTFLTHNGHRGGFQFAPQQTHGRHSIIRRGAGRMLAPRPSVVSSLQREASEPLRGWSQTIDHRAARRGC